MKVEAITSKKQHDLYLKRMKVVFGVKENTPESIEIRQAC